MPPVHGVPILLSILVVLSISLVAWGIIRLPGQQQDDALMGAHGDLLLGLLILAAFISGVFLTYLLLRTGF